MSEGAAVAAIVLARAPALASALECKEYRSDRIGRLRIGDHHPADRLGLGRDRLPDAQDVEHPLGSGGDGRCPFVLLPHAFRRGIDDHDIEMGGRLFQRYGKREADIAAPAIRTSIIRLVSRRT